MIPDRAAVAAIAKAIQSFEVICSMKRFFGTGNQS
jgi:hypothetical protein